MKTLVAILLFALPCFSQNTAGKIVLKDALIPPWRDTDAAQYNQGVASKGLRQYYGIGFRGGQWGMPLYLDSTQMTGGKLHFMFKASKSGNTISFWLAGDDLGNMPAKIFKSDTMWRSIDTLFNSLNPFKRRVNTIKIQNNGADSIMAYVKEVWFMPRDTAITPKPPRINYIYIDTRDTVIVYDRLSFGAIVVDSFPLKSIDFVLQSPQDSPMVAGAQQYTILSKDSTFAYTEWDVNDLEGVYDAGIRAINVRGFGLYKPFKVKIVHRVDSLKYNDGWNDALDAVPDSVPTNKPPRK